MFLAGKKGLKSKKRRSIYERKWGWPERLNRGGREVKLEEYAGALNWKGEETLGGEKKTWSASPRKDKGNGPYSLSMTGKARNLPRKMHGGP